MVLLSDVKAYSRFCLGLRRFLRRRMTFEQAEAIIRQRMERREDCFLTVVQRNIFGNPRSPYGQLLKLAGCGYGDIEKMVRADGVESALRALYDAGVYVTFEEFKGRSPIVRQGREIPATPTDFNNPLLDTYWTVQSGGSTGPGTRTFVDLESLWAEAPVFVLVRYLQSVLHLPSILWRGILPARAGIAGVLRGPVIGQIPERWFSPIMSRDVGLPLKYRAATAYILAVGRLLGHRMPSPEPVPLDQPGPVLDWVIKALRTHGVCYVSAAVSAAVRVCVAAQERGLDLTGAVFRGGSEPPTPGKVREVTKTGARWIPNYAATEVGPIAAACMQPQDENDLHVLKDSVALIQCARQVPGYDVSVGVFHVTTLQPTSPKLLLNVGLDDFGILETRHCGCPFEQYGFIEHVRGIRSYSKMTGEGVTLVNTQMERILEETLPARFGGTLIDYQLLEEEDERGFTRLSLVVSPKIDLPDEKAAVRTVLDAMAHGGLPEAYAGAFWRQADSLRVKRMEPLWSAGGKFLPLCVADRIRAAGAGAVGAVRPPQLHSGESGST